MSNPIQDGGFAFPRPSVEITGEERNWGQTGMTLRDWFAGQSLAVIPHIGCGADLSNEEIAEAAYQLADAMLAAREPKQP